jgi:hypothetical protein
MYRQIVSAVAIVVGLTAAPAARAQVVMFSSFGSNNSYNSGDAQEIYQPYTWAVSFVPTVSGNVNTISLPLENISGTNAMSLTLAFNGTNSNPGTNIESWNITGLTNYSQNGGNGSVMTVTSLSQTLLTAGTTYWLEASAPAGTTDAWYTNLAGLRDNYQWTTDGATWQHFTAGNLGGALEITGVPEPTSLALVSGSGLVAVIWRRRRAGSRLVAQPASGAGA